MDETGRCGLSRCFGAAFTAPPSAMRLADWSPVCFCCSTFTIPRWARARDGMRTSILWRMIRRRWRVR